MAFEEGRFHEGTVKTYIVTLDGREQAVQLDDQGVIRVEGSAEVIDVCRMSSAEYSVMVGTKTVKVVALINGEAIHLLAGSREIVARVESERSRLLRQYARSTGSSGSKMEVRAPMPALVVRVEVETGQEIAAGQGLVVLEAMKMENEIRAHQGGRVKEVYVKPGKAVEKGELLLILE